MKRPSILKVSALLFASVAMSGPALAQEEQGASDEVQTELVKAKSSFKETWVHPEADFTQYSKLYLWDGQFEYRDVGPARRTSSVLMRTHKREFGISDKDRMAFEKVVSEAFVGEILKAKKFDVVDEIGPDTLIMRGAALDIISKIPPDTIGPSDIYLAVLGEATLVFELIDAETGETIAVVSERRRIEPVGGSRIDEFSMPANRATITADVKRWAKRAATKLRTEIEKAISGKK